MSEPEDPSIWLDRASTRAHHVLEDLYSEAYAMIHEAPTGPAPRHGHRNWKDEGRHRQWPAAQARGADPSMTEGSL